MEMDLPFIEADECGPSPKRHTPFSHSTTGDARRFEIGLNIN
jgi:hypothetical protein